MATNKIDFQALKDLLKTKGEIIILSTDDDVRFDEAKEALKNEVSNIEFIKVNAEYIANYDASAKEEMLNLYLELRQGKEEEAKLKENFNDVNIFANLMVKSGRAHGIVSGATHPTSDILRPAFQIIKPAEKGVISSFMWLHKEEVKDLFFADVSVMPNPDAEQLSQIAVQTANSVEKVFGVKPVVAMLSFSTNGSGGKVEEVLKVQEATRLAKEKGIEVYGDIQWDAANRPEIFASKMKIDAPEDMPNVFIFPDLNAGNISYKLASTLGGYQAVGPILQNISAPVNDLSRGCTSSEIVDLVIITALQSINK